MEIMDHKLFINPTYQKIETNDWQILKKLFWFQSPKFLYISKLYEVDG
jgi:hypothetical protein